MAGNGGLSGSVCRNALIPSHPMKPNTEHLLEEELKTRKRSRNYVGWGFLMLCVGVCWAIASPTMVPLLLMLGGFGLCVLGRMLS
jgi:hypothetical protein